MTASAKRVLRSQLKKNGLTVRDLAFRLTVAGTPISEKALRKKITRDAFSANFLLRCLDLIEVELLVLKGGPFLVAGPGPYAKQGAAH